MIRSAAINDAGRIAEIIINSWRYAYKDFLSEEVLYKQLSIEDRIQAVKVWIKENEEYIYVFEDENNKVIKGMMGINDCNDTDKLGYYEMHILYVDPIFSRNGIGLQMIKYFEDKGKHNGKNGYVIWVLEDNIIGRKFYEKMGYKSDNSKKVFSRINKDEIRYLKDIDMIN